MTWRETAIIKLLLHTRHLRADQKLNQRDSFICNVAVQLLNLRNTLRHLAQLAVLIIWDHTLQLVEFQLDRAHIFHLLRKPRPRVNVTGERARRIRRIRRSAKNRRAADEERERRRRRRGGGRFGACWVPCYCLVACCCSIGPFFPKCSDRETDESVKSALTGKRMSQSKCTDGAPALEPTHNKK